MIYCMVVIWFRKYIYNQEKFISLYHGTYSTVNNLTIIWCSSSSLQLCSPLSKFFSHAYQMLRDKHIISYLFCQHHIMEPFLHWPMMFILEILGIPEWHVNINSINYFHRLTITIYLFIFIIQCKQLIRISLFIQVWIVSMTTLRWC